MRGAVFPPTPIRLHGVVLSLKNTRTILPYLYLYPYLRNGLPQPLPDVHSDVTWCLCQSNAILNSSLCCDTLLRNSRTTNSGMGLELHCCSIAQVTGVAHCCHVWTLWSCHWSLADKWNENCHIENGFLKYWGIRCGYSKYMNSRF